MTKFYQMKYQELQKFRRNLQFCFHSKLGPAKKFGTLYLHVVYYQRRAVSDGCVGKVRECRLRLPTAVQKLHLRCHLLCRTLAFEQPESPSRLRLIFEFLAVPLVFRFADAKCNTDELMNAFRFYK